jgi:hypothetical protein
MGNINTVEPHSMGPNLRVSIMYYSISIDARLITSEFFFSGAQP